MQFATAKTSKDVEELQVRGRFGRRRVAGSWATGHVGSKKGGQ